MKKLFSRPWVGPLLALIAVWTLFAVWTPDTFLRAQNLVTMARQTAVVAVAALGMTLVIVHGGIDLSIGSSVALTTVVVASLLKHGQSLGLAISGGLATAMVTGLLQGFLIARLKIAPFIVTLGGMTILRGFAKGLAKEQKIDVDVRGLEALLSPPKATWMVFPWGVWLAIGLAGCAYVLLERTRLGRHIYAVGSNEAAARLCGIRVENVRLGVYALSGLAAGIAGVLELSTLTVGDPTTSVGLELDVIAAVVIGGAALSGGEGSIAGAMIGALLMTVIKTGCTYVGLPNWVQEIVTGVIILVAVGLDRFRRRS